MLSTFRRLLICTAVAIGGPAACVAQTSAPGAVRLSQGESLTTLKFSVRRNFITPSQVTVEEGWYRIVILDPQRVAGQQSVSLRSEGEVTLTSSKFDDRDSRTSLFYRLSPGRQKLRLGSKNEWVVQIDVTAKKAK